MSAMTRMLRRLSPGRAGWVSAIQLSLVVVVGALLSIRSHLSMRNDRELVVHSFEVLRAADDVLIGSLDAETGQRGFVITGNPEFLAPYPRAIEAVPAALEQLRKLVGDNAQQLDLIHALTEVTDPKLEELKLTVATRTTQGFPSAQSLVAERKGKMQWTASGRSPGRSNSPNSGCSPLDLRKFIMMSNKSWRSLF